MCDLHRERLVPRGVGLLMLSMPLSHNEFIDYMDRASYSDALVMHTS